MHKHQRRLSWLMLTAMLISLIYGTPLPASAAAGDAEASAETSRPAHSWIMKWNEGPTPEFVAESSMLRVYDATYTVVATPAAGQSEEEWLAKWQQAPEVAYMVPNQQVGIHETTNDPFLDKQSYLTQTHTIEAWDQVKQNDSMIIAVVDTGIDLDHPDLKDNLVQGINLVQPHLPPKDDNGHGTNVAGVIAAIGNNGQGVSGMLWKAGIMPIKALEPSGRGDEDKLGAGIRYAVDNGAKIVVLSVGLLRNDSYLQEIVQYAEDHDVLLVAASGNDEGRIIRYPAAYPTVMAVGGVRENRSVEERSNYGPELDIVAPWSVFTTAMGGKYEYRDGTSMAAPQVAAAAAMVWTQYPHLKAHEVRNLLRQTADDIGRPGWDEFTGYGLLRVDRALNEPYQTDMYEPNDRRSEAKPFSTGRMLSAELSGGMDIDWYQMDVPYDGTLHVSLVSDLAAPSSVRLLHASSVGVFAYQIEPGTALPLKVVQGRNDFALQFEDELEASMWPYRLSASFSIYKDPFEDNDRQFQAYKLPARSQSITGTFSHENDEDWFMMTFEQSGLLTVQVTPDTRRIDPVLTIQKKGERAITIDDNDDGEMELYSLEVFPDTYYYRVSKVMGSPAVGEYRLDIRYEPRFIDPNEPNDRAFQATVIRPGTTYEGVFDSAQDIDYFKFTLDGRTQAHLRLTDIPTSQEVSLTLQNSSLGTMSRQTNAAAGLIELRAPLESGTYYVRLQASEAAQDNLYKLSFSTEPIQSEFADLTGHWAKEAIYRLMAAGISDGYGGQMYYPDKAVTRAEAAMLLTRAFRYEPSSGSAFPDVPSEHWAFDAINRAAGAGIVDGYPDSRFRPDGLLSRAEMAALFAKVLGVSGAAESTPFADIKSDYWGAQTIALLYDQGWVDGHGDGTFRPEASTTRAEFAVMLTRIMDR